MTNRGRIILIIAAAILAQFALSITLYLRFMARNPDRLFAQEVIAALSGGDWEKLTSRLGPSYGRFDPQTVVEEMADLLPPGPPKEITTENTIVLRDSDGVRSEWVTLNCQYPDHDPIRVRLLLKGDWSGLQLDGFELLTDASAEGATSGPIVHPTSAPPAATEPTNWGLVHVVFAILTPGAFLFSLREFVRSLKQADRQHRTGDAIVSLIGAGEFWLHWPSGWWGFWPFSVQLFSFGLSAPGFSGPWSPSFSIPLGALYVRHLRRKRLEAQALKAACAALPPSDRTFSEPGPENENTGGLAPAGDSKS